MASKFASMAVILLSSMTPFPLLLPLENSDGAFILHLARSSIGSLASSALFRLNTPQHEASIMPLEVSFKACGPALFNVRPHSMGETRFLFMCVCVGKPFKKMFWSRHLFLFYFKGKKQNKKKKP